MGGAWWRGERARALSGCPGWRGHCRNFQRRRGSSPPTRGIGQACVRGAGQGEEAACNAPGRTVAAWPSLTKEKNDWISELSKLAKEQCSSGVRQNVFGLWDFSLSWFLVEFLEECRYEFHQIWQIWSKLAENEFWKFWKEEEWIKMVLGCGYKGLSWRVGLSPKLKCKRVLSLKITQAPNNYQNWFERKNN